MASVVVLLLLLLERFTEKLVLNKDGKRQQLFKIDSKKSVQVEKLFA